MILEVINASITILKSTQYKKLLPNAFLVKFWLNLNWRKKTLQTNSLKVDDQYGSTVLSKRIQKFLSFSHSSNHEYAKKTRQNVVLCGGLEEKIWREAYIKGWAQATKGRRKPEGLHGPTDYEHPMKA